MQRLLIDLEGLGPAERRDLANALLRAAWSAALQETRIMLLDLFRLPAERPHGRSTARIYYGVS